jgi:hypothetical protein
MASKRAERAGRARSGRKGPLITVTCKCGQSGQLHYGELWKCPGCGRKLATNEISPDEYAEIRRQQLRFRMFPLVSTALLVVAVIVLFASGKTVAAILAIPFVVVVWTLFGRPLLRSR